MRSISGVEAEEHDRRMKLHVTHTSNHAKVRGQRAERAASVTGIDMESGTERSRAAWMRSKAKRAGQAVGWRTDLG